jgi:hypothetical protein
VWPGAVVVVVVVVAVVVVVVAGAGRPTGLPVLVPPWLSAGRKVLADAIRAPLRGTAMATLAASATERATRLVLAR